VLFNKDRQELGRFEWCVVTSHTVGHKRWEQVFGFPPPLEALAAKETSLKPMIDPLATVASHPIMVAMLAFPRDGAPSIMQLDFDLAEGAVPGSGFRVSGFGLRVSGFGFRVSGFEFRV